VDDFVLRALLGGAAISIAAGPLGCLLIWRRMAYFGAAVSHSALLGVAVGLLLEVNVTISAVIFCILMAFVLLGLQNLRVLAADTLIGIVGHAALALGVVVSVWYLTSVRVDLIAYLFGDILALSWIDVLLAWMMAAGVGSALWFLWTPTLNLTIAEDLAIAEGVNAGVHQALLMGLIGLVVGVGIKAVGVLLIVALLIIPAAAARIWTRTPEMMAVLAAAIGVGAVFLGLGASVQADVPAGPAIVLAASVLFLASWLKGFFGWSVDDARAS
jgi:zinc transport system permease protein